MNTNHRIFALSVLAAFPLHSAFADALIRTATGTSVEVTAARDAFRADVGGGATAGSNGSFGGLRREINWDGVPDTSSAPNSLAANFFNTTSPRGVVFVTAGSGFQVSADAANSDSEPVEFGGASGNPSYPTNFAPFSAERLFTPLGSNTLEVDFLVPGTSTLASVTSFGAIFSDVDISGSTSIEYFDRFNNSLGEFLVPATSGNESFSFLGVTFTGGEKVAYVKIKSGNAVFGSTEASSGDVVVMDDFLYSEPVALSTLGDIAVTSPNGGASLTVGATQTVTWSPSSTGAPVTIELSRNGGTTFETLFESTSDDGTENWTVSGPVTTQALIRVTSTLDSSITDTSNSAFSIVTSATVLPDLSVSLSNTRYSNGRFSGRVTVSNKGTAASAASVIDLYHSANSTVGTGDTLSSRRTLGAIGVNRSKSYNFNVAATRNRRLIGFADALNNNIESNEGNNVTVKTVR